MAVPAIFVKKKTWPYKLEINLPISNYLVQN